MRNIAVVSICVALAAPATTWARAPTISKTEARKLSRAQTKGIVLQQLGEVLVETLRPSSRGVRPVRPLSRLSFWTLPRPTYVVGLCAADRVEVGFRIVGPARGADTSVRADSIRAETHYRFAVQPTSETPGREVTPGRDPSRCGRLDPEHQDFFSAPNAQMATNAIWRLRAAVAAAATDKVDFRLECHTIQRADPATCRGELAAVGAIKDGSVEPCEADRDLGLGAGCWDVWLANNSIRIQSAAGDSAPAARVTLRELVVVADAIVD